MSKILTPEQAKEICKLGQGELCCAYLAMADGWECLKGTLFEPNIWFMLEAGMTNAKGDYCILGYEGETQ